MQGDIKSIIVIDYIKLVWLSVGCNLKVRILLTPILRPAGVTLNHAALPGHGVGLKEDVTGDSQHVQFSFDIGYGGWSLQAAPVSRSVTPGRRWELAVLWFGGSEREGCSWGNADHIYVKVAHRPVGVPTSAAYRTICKPLRRFVNPHCCRTYGTVIGTS